MSERTVSIRTRRTQRAYGDTQYVAEVDFHLGSSQFGGQPPERTAIEVVRALWPSATNVDFHARPAPDATVREDHWGTYADRWIVSGKVTYTG